MSLLRTLTEQYSQGHISLLEYRTQRSQLLALIDEDLNGIKFPLKEEQNDEDISVSFVDKALSFLKIDQH